MTATLQTLYSGVMASSQVVTTSGSPTGGFLVLTVRNVSTATSGGSAITYSATTAAVQTALAALSNVGNGNVTVSGSTGGPFTVAFSGSALDSNGISPRLVATAAYMTGGTPSVTVTGTDTDVYQVPSAKTAKVATGTLTNISGQAVTVGVGITPSGHTSGLTYKSMYGKILDAYESISLADYIGGDMLGAGDKISVYSTLPGGVSVKVTGAVLS